MYILWNIIILCLFLLLAKESQPVSQCKRLMDTNLVAPVTMRAALF